MNKRQRKKSNKNFHKQFCCRVIKESNQCPKCGWDAVMADPDLQLGRILWRRGGFYDLEFEVEYKCPVCGTVFSYMDGV